MQTPDNRAGQVTEFIMADVRAKFPEGLETWQYNRIYEAVYHRLESELPQGDRLDGVGRIAVERSRQIQTEGYDPAHDDKHVHGEIADAAACYAMTRRGRVEVGIEKLWRWGRQWWKPASSGNALPPKPRIRDLEKAGALCAAEIDRLLRLS